MTLPQRVNFVTLGAHSVVLLRDFYRVWGWTENEGASDSYASVSAGSVTVALYDIDRLGEEAAPGAEVPAPGNWAGFTLAINFSDRSGVDAAIAEAVAAGAVLVDGPSDRDWGGYSGYVADPEGHRWELAWAPGSDPG